MINLKKLKNHPKDKRAIIMSIIFFLIILLTTGCWDKEEIDKKAIIAGVGIDRSEGQEGIKLTAQVVLPGEVQKLSAKQSAVWLGTVTGTSVFDAARNLTLITGNKALWSHSRVLVIGEDAAKSGVNDLVDWFERDHELRRRTNIFISKGGAQEVIEAKSGRERVPAFDIMELAEVGKVTSKVALVDLHQFFSRVASKTTCAVVPGLEVYEKVDDEGNRNIAVRTSGTAIFKDYKLKAWIDDNETRGMMWVIDEVKHGVIEVENLLNDGTLISLEIIRAKSKIKPEIKNGEISILVEVKEEGNIGGVPIPSADLSKPENIRELEIRAEKSIKKEITHVIKKAQELNTDIFGFGQAVYRKYPKEWKTLEKEWDELFPNLKVEVKVNAKIRRTGLVTNESL